jgi:hypothetical protein
MFPPFVELWHPDSPGMKVVVRPCWLRRWRLVRSEFATLGELKSMYRGRPRRYLQ